MPTGNLQAKRYSQAIFEIAREHNTFDKWSEDLKKVQALMQNIDFVSVMDDPRFSFEDKSKLISTNLKSVDPLVLNLVKLLISRSKFSLIAEIYSEFLELLDAYYGIEKAEVITAVPIEEEEREKLISRLETITAKKINLSTKVDPNIMAGIIIKVAGKLIDGSTKSQLTALRGEMISGTS